MKRLIFTVTNDLNYDRRMMRACTTLVDAGYDVKIIGRLQYNSLAIVSQSYNQKRLRCLFETGKAFYIEYNIRLFFYLLFQKFDAACAVDLDTILPVLIVSKLRRKKRFYDAHEYFTEVPELTGRPFTKSIWEKIGSFSIRKMTSCYTVSESLSTIFKEKYHKEFEVVRNIPLLLPFGKVKKQGKMILYQGAVNQGRGLEQLIDAIEDIDIQVVIAGYGDIQQKIKQLIEAKGYQYKVILTGYLTPSQLYEQTAKAYIGYNLLDPVSLSYFYSLSNKFFDYIHAAIPSLSNPFPEYIKINQQYKVSHLTELNTEEIKKAIIYLLENQDYYHELQNNCLKAREIFNWQEEQQKLVQIYNDQL
jgi:glycosyltransferase involved in cell wall biosynthesis